MEAKKTTVRAAPVLGSIYYARREAKLRKHNAPGDLFSSFPEPRKLLMHHFQREPVSDSEMGVISEGLSKE